MSETLNQNLEVEKKDSIKIENNIQHKKVYITLSVIVFLIIISFIVPLLIPSVKKGVDIDETTANDMLLSVHTHFDNPVERILVLRYQIVAKSVWQGSDKYQVAGLTLFGIKFNQADVYLNGGIFTIPSLENDLIIKEAI